MSYRSSDQALEEPIDKILEGIAELGEAVDRRIESGEWQESHIDEIVRLQQDLIAFKMRLHKIKRDTW